jgi:hypothetical protein
MIAVKGVFSGFSVRDQETAKLFYEKIGLKVESDEMGLQIKLPEGGEVFVYQKEDHQPASFTILNLVVDDIDAAVDALMVDGIALEKYSNLPAPQDEKGILRGLAAKQGPDIAWFKDPSGNVLAVLQTA